MPDRSELDAMKRMHLEYELRMLQFAASILSKPAREKSSRIEQMRRFMVIESFYVHLRNLDSFFYETGGKRGKRDAFAVDFFRAPQVWRRESGRPRRSSEMRKAVKLAGTMVVHLSYDRHAALEAGESLNWLKLGREMDRVFGAFRDALRAEQGIVLLDRDFSIIPRGIGASADEIAATTSTATTNVFEVRIFDWKLCR